MGAVSERLDLPLWKVRAYLGINGKHEDPVLQIMLDAAKAAADDYMRCDFKDEAGNELPIPAPVALGVLKHIAHSYEHRTDGVVAQSVTGLGAVTWGVPEGARREWDQYRVVPGL